MREKEEVDEGIGFAGEATGDIGVVDPSTIRMIDESVGEHDKVMADFK